MAKHTASHEAFDRRVETKPTSDRAFGLLFAALFAILGLWPLLDLDWPRWWSIALAAGFFVFAVMRPALLSPLNRAWTAFGYLLHAIMTPVVMGVLFFLVVTPVALLMRCFGKVPLQLRYDPTARSYWIQRIPAGPAPDTMNRQF